MRARRDTTWSNRAVTFIDPQRTRSLPTAELTAHETGAIRELLWAAFEADEDGFSEDDWQHALGGRHVVVEDGGRIVSHAAVVERAIEIGGERLRAGCVEAVATVPEEQARGHGTRAMTAVGELIRTGFEIGVRHEIGPSLSVSAAMAREKAIRQASAVLPSRVAISLPASARRPGPISTS